MARKDNSPAISFFSFQDIITSVTGIMFLVMLLLTLILLMRDMGGADTSAEDQAIRELKDSVRQLQEQLTRAANRSEELRRRLEELRKLDAKSLPVRRDELKRLIAQMEGDLARMAALQDTTVKQAEDTAAQALAIRETSKDEKKTLDEMLAEVAALTEQKKKLEDAAQKSQYVMRFTWRKRSAKKPLLVECSGKNIRVGGADNSAPLVSFSCSGGSEEQLEMAAKFLEWARRQSPDDVYFLLLVKPSAFEMSEQLAILLGKNRFQRGREVLPNEDVSVFDMAVEASNP